MKVSTGEAGFPVLALAKLLTMFRAEHETGKRATGAAAKQPAQRKARSCSKWDDLQSVGLATRSISMIPSGYTTAKPKRCCV